MGSLKAVPGVRAAKNGDGAVSDSVGVQSVVIGADLVLTVTDDRRITLHALTSRGNHELGTFDDVRAAWTVVDSIDLGSRPVRDWTADELEGDNRAQVAAAAGTRSIDGLRAA